MAICADQIIGLAVYRDKAELPDAAFIEVIDIFADCLESGQHVAVFVDIPHAAACADPFVFDELSVAAEVIGVVFVGDPAGLLCS